MSYHQAHCRHPLGRLRGNNVFCALWEGHAGAHRPSFAKAAPAHRPLPPRDWYRRDGLNVADPVTATDGFGDRL